MFYLLAVLRRMQYVHQRQTDVEAQRGVGVACAHSLPQATDPIVNSLPLQIVNAQVVAGRRVVGKPLEVMRGLLLLAVALQDVRPVELDEGGAGLHLDVLLEQHGVTSAKQHCARAPCTPTTWPSLQRGYGGLWSRALDQSRYGEAQARRVVESLGVLRTDGDRHVRGQQGETE